VSKNEKCDRCGKVIHGYIVEIGNICLCGECVAYLQEQAQVKHQEMARKIRGKKESEK
jgi:hypothetical protein